MRKGYLVKQTFFPGLTHLMKRILVSLCFMALLVGGTVSGCKKEKKTDKDIELFEESSATSGYTYYNQDATIRTSSNPSAHNPYFRVRFNSVANTALTDNGKLPQGGSFPDGSIVVKELYDSPTGGIKLYAIMKKEDHPDAGAGWLWAEYEDDGKVVYSVSNGGDGCTGCHSADDRDYVRIFELFP